MENKLILGCVADDFTGASDAASFLAADGLQTVLFNGIPNADQIPEQMQAAVIALKSRTQETNAAVKDSMSAVEWLKNRGAQTIYIKYCSTFDSTPKGNIGPICDAAMEQLDLPYTVLCPSLPVNKRTVEKGCLYVDGVPLAQTHMNHHPLTPMWDSFIPTLMKEQSKYPCFVISREMMQLGKQDVLKSIDHNCKTSNHFYVVPDFSTDEDAELICSVFGDLPLLTGGSGLMEPLASKKACAKKAPREVESQQSGKAILFAGSCSAATQAQVTHFLQTGGKGIMLEPQKLLCKEQTPETVWQDMRKFESDEVLIYSSGSCGKKVSGTDRTQEASILEQTMACIAKMAVQNGYQRIIVAGGETSGAVTKSLGLFSYYIGKSIAPGVPIMMPTQNKTIQLVLKSGNFGQKDFFARALAQTGGKTHE